MPKRSSNNGRKPQSRRQTSAAEDLDNLAQNLDDLANLDDDYYDEDEDEYDERLLNQQRYRTRTEYRPMPLRGNPRRRVYEVDPYDVGLVLGDLFCKFMGWR